MKQKQNFIVCSLSYKRNQQNIRKVQRKSRTQKPKIMNKYWSAQWIRKGRKCCKLKWKMYSRRKHESLFKQLMKIKQKKMKKVIFKINSEIFFFNLFSIPFNVDVKAWRMRSSERRRWLLLLLLLHIIPWQFSCENFTRRCFSFKKISNLIPAN